MTSTQRTTDRSFRFLLLIIAVLAMTLFEVLSIYAQQPTNKTSRFSSNTLKIGIQSYLSDRLEESDEYELVGTIEDQILDEQFVVARCEAADGSLSGNTTISLVFSKNDRVLKRVSVPVRIKLKRKVAVLIRQVERGEILSSSDVEYKVMDVTYLNATPAKTFIGMRAVQTLLKGGVLLDKMLTDNSGVQKGDMVQIVLTNGNVTVRSTGVALDDAKIGQQLRVRRTDSSVILNAVANDDKSVTVVSSTQVDTSRR